MAGKNDGLLDEMKEALSKGSTADKRAIIKAMQTAGQQWLTDKEFHEQFDFGIEIAKDRGDDEMGMQFWMYGVSLEDDAPEENKKVVMPVLFADWEPKDDKEKSLMMQGLGIKFTEQFPKYMLTTIVHVAEGWGVNRSEDTPEEDWHVAPSKSPNRVEVAFVTATSMDQRQAWWQSEIIRNDDGSFKELKEVFNERHDQDDPLLFKSGQCDKLSYEILRGYGKAKTSLLDKEE